MELRQKCHQTSNTRTCRRGRGQESPWAHFIIAKCAKPLGKPRVMSQRLPQTCCIKYAADGWQESPQARIFTDS